MRRLQINEDPELQRKVWRAERVGWGVLAATVLAAAAGAFGAGPLSHAEARSQDGALRVEYPRLGRMQSPLTVRLTVQSPPSGPLRVWISRDYLRELDIRHVTPPPEHAELGGERVIFEFPWAGAPGEAAVTFLLEASGPGTVRGRIGVGEETQVSLAHFLYP